MATAKEQSLSTQINNQESQKYQDALAAVSKNGLALRNISPNIAGYREVVLAAVKNNGLALAFASPELKKDREVVFAAVLNNKMALRYVSNEIIKDPELNKILQEQNLIKVVEPVNVQTISVEQKPLKLEIDLGAKDIALLAKSLVGIAMDLYLAGKKDLTREDSGGDNQDFYLKAPFTDIEAGLLLLIGDVGDEEIKKIKDEFSAEPSLFKEKFPTSIGDLDIDKIKSFFDDLFENIKINSQDQKESEPESPSTKVGVLSFSKLGGEGKGIDNGLG